jgi:hypothetical protein
VSAGGHAWAGDGGGDLVGCPAVEESLRRFVGFPVERLQALALGVYCRLRNDFAYDAMSPDWGRIMGRLGEVAASA